MKNFDNAREAFKTVLCKVGDSKFYESIEMVLLKKDKIYEDEIGVKVFVNSKRITNKDLNIPYSIKNTKIILEYKILENNLFNKLNPN